MVKEGTMSQLVPAQKAAWLTLAVACASILAFGVLIPVVGLKAAPAAFGILGVTGLGALYFRPSRGDSRLILDERDRLIESRSQLLGFKLFWVAFVGTCMVSWALARYGWRQETVSVDLLPGLVLGGFIVYSVAHAVAVLAQYGQSRSDGRQ
jgi:hypothetical protein